MFSSMALGSCCAADFLSKAVGDFSERSFSASLSELPANGRLLSIFPRLSITARLQSFFRKLSETAGVCCAAVFLSKAFGYSHTIIFACNAF